MNILFYLHEFCYPLRGGDRIRIFHFLDKLRRSHSLYLVSLTQFGVEQESLEKLRPYFQDITIIENKKRIVLWKYLKSLLTGVPYKVIHYTSKKAEQAIRSVIQRYNIDVLVLDYFFTATESIRKLKIKKCLLSPNLEYVLLKRFIQYGNINRKIYGFSQWKSLMRYEINSYSYFDKTIFVSKNDERQAKIRNPAIDSDVIEGGVDIQHFSTKRKKMPSHPHLIFIGTMWYYPNIQAVTYFLKEIMPLIKKEVEDVRFTIVGDHPSEKVTELAKKHEVSLFGSVTDVRDFIDEASVFVVPQRIVSGVPYKILEALSMKIPVISTAEGCEGLMVAHGENIMIGDTPEKFARCVVNVIKDRDLWEKVSAKGRSFVEAYHRADILAGKLDKILCGIVDQRIF